MNARVGYPKPSVLPRSFLPVPNARGEKRSAGGEHTGVPCRSVSPLPGISRPLLGLFTWYARRYLRRHFHALRVAVAGKPSECDRLPLVIYCNHASWWDPLVCLALKERFFPDRVAYAPIAADALERYKFFGKLGFFGVDQGTMRGAKDFLCASEQVLASPDRMLALTPQGRFADTRERPARFQGGLGRLAARAEGALFIPLAIEYVFWEERLPEILVRFGEGVPASAGAQGTWSPQEWTRVLETALENTQDTLAAESERRNPSGFESVLTGGAGQGGVYDCWRWLTARLRGKKFRKEHGTR